MRKSLLFFLFSLFCTHLLFCQNTLRGKVVDATTNEPLAFATLIFNKNPSLGTMTDIDGRFSFRSRKNLQTITISYVGYATKMIPLENEGFILVELKPVRNELPKVVLTPGENPAHRIIRKTIENKPLNDPMELNSFSYCAYTKTIFDTEEKDSTARMKIFKGSYIFMMESVSKRNYKKPDLSEEVVIATKVSGFDDPRFAALATDFQPFSFYGDVFRLYDVNYLNPISKGSIKKYDFQLRDTLYQKWDSVYVISFQPFPKKNFQGLKGVLYINTNGYAVQNVIAEPAEQGKINMKIQQQYAFVNNQHWFPKQLNYELVFSDGPAEAGKIYVEGKSYIDSIHFDIPLERDDFSIKSVRLAEDASEKDSVFWEKYRVKDLIAKEKKTYKTLDSLGNEYHFDRYLDVFANLVSGKVQLGFVDLDLSKTLIFNEYEGFRLGTGIYTNEKVSKDFTLGGFFGYGFRDKAWKYGGKIAFHPYGKNQFTITAAYRNDLMEAGNYGLKPSPNIFNLRRYISARFDQNETYSLNFSFRSFRYLTWEIGFSHSKTTPKYAYRFAGEETVFSNYKNSVLSVNARFAYGEDLVSLFGRLIPSSTDYPVLFLSYRKGISGVFESNLDYQKLELAAEHSFYTRGLGTTHFRLEGGFVNDPVPYGLLFTGSGSFEDDLPIIMRNHFQTMLPYEFLSNRYANLFFTHDFGTLLFKTKNFQPKLSIHQNIGLGELSHPEKHQLLGFKTMEEVFLETGFQIDNIVKLNYLDIGYLGIGFGAFYRFGAYSLPEFDDNLALKVTLGFTIK